MSGLSHTKGREGKTIEQIYQKKTQLEHILLRPDTYVGSVEPQQQELWVFDSVQSRMVHRNISYVPALYKIFDEILVNAADNFMRDPEHMNTIKVDIDQQQGKISVWNNGKGLPVVIHKEHGIYVPELVFGNLLTSDNYNDGDCKVVGGRNGYGAKLTNIFSTEFIVETADGQKKYKQRFKKNMTEKAKPEIANSKEKSFTCITFKPELSRFGMEKLDTDIVSLLTKRVYDIAGSTDEKCTVYLNGEKLDIKNFKDYVDLYLLTRQGVPKLFEKVGDRWEVGLSLTESGFQQVSFVNSICTIRGGTHVTQVSDQIVESILEKVKIMSKEKCKGGLDIRPHHVRTNLWVFIRCLIENPAFDSQTKETLTTKQSKFGSRCELSEEFLDKAANCGVADMILQAAMAKSKVDLGKKLKANTGRITRLTGVPKLEDANDAGGKNSADCTLILTEGDSAKALAVAGLSVIGRDRFGVFPLRGKVLNVRDATLKSMMDNAEIQNIIKIVGLDFNREYDEELKGLRYGSIMIMTDQDHDGSHIKGLIINLIHAWWPSLAKLKGFIKEFFTPIVKVSRGKQVVPFFTMPDYEKWKEETDNGKGWKTKYYKGLGTSTSKEAKEYFSKLESHKMAYRWDDGEDDQAIDLAFNKKRADDRKDWINGYKEGDLVDHSQPEVSYRDFINKELVLFSKANVIRAIPSIMDGFKPSQRKVLFGCFKRKLKNDVKVAQLTGYVSEHAAYHHGEVSLQETIVGMAQDFVGSNNINLLVPQGQFGTRLQGGKDAASARYIYTRLSPVTRCIFKEEDEKILKSQSEDGMTIEPEWYCPVIPMVLVNGCDGIGTGWASSVPCFNPREIIANLRKYIDQRDMKEMTPWYQGYKGPISEMGKDGKCEVTGIVEVVSSSKAIITELPIRKWTQDYKEFLEELLPKPGEKKTNKVLEDINAHHTEKTVHFEVILSQEGGWRDSDETSLMKAFRLRSTIPLTNMILFDSEGRVKKYESPLHIIEEFAFVRLIKYQERKDYMLGLLARECEILSAKARFIKLVLQGEIVIKRRKIQDLIQELRTRAFKPMSEIKGPASAEGNDGEGAGEDKEDDDGDNEDEEEAGDDDQEEGEENKARKKAVAKGVKDYEYLVGMPISTLTREKVEELMRQRDLKTAEHDTLKKKTKEQLWLEDLKQLEAALDERDAAREREEKLEQTKLQKALRGEQAAPKRGVKRAASAPPSAGSSSDQAAGSRKRAADTSTEAGGGRGKTRK
mmetsp:Transcript_78448/g.139080  ORF Transcript_78448/g.139080 Transcript_78448/m.139080 type:complete len:1248 (-) Transcript_78448:91-3834(-)